MRENREPRHSRKKPKRMLWGWVDASQRKHPYMDYRTEKYLQRIEKQIGLLAINDRWEHSLMSVDYKFPLFWNPTCEGQAHVGRKGSQWIAQVSLLQQEVQYDVVRYIFSKCPTPEDILTANTLNKIYAYFRTYPNSKPYVNCHQCHHQFHWTQQEGTLEDKWLSYQEQHCGCN